MNKEEGLSFRIIHKLGCTQKYYERDNMFWFKDDPAIIFIMNEDGTIILRELFTERKVSIYELWEKFDNEQKKLIVYNLDKFI